VTEHLFVSTVVLALAMIAARFLPLTARTRYAVLLCGIVKFAIPTAVFRFVPAAAIPTQLRTFGGGATAVVAQTTTRVEWIPILWVAIGALLIARWMLLRTRTISAALRLPSAASLRELDAVRNARLTLGIRTAVDVLRSPICEAPAVLRVIRPVIVLPAHGCDELTDDELRSLVLHECAHVARHDNLATILQAFATSLLWFHPLVWFASRALTVTREEACDEAVADAMRDTDAYVSALTKICHAIAAPRTAGASCMANAKIRERMEHLMSYEAIKGKAWSHRAMLLAGALTIALSTIAATTPAAMQTERYVLAYTMDPIGKSLTYDITVTDRETGKVIAQPRLTTQPGMQGQIKTGTQNGTDGTSRELQITISPDITGSGRITLDVFDGETLVQHSEQTYAAGAAPRKYTGEPISMTLKDAELHDVLRTFGQLTGLAVDVAPGISGSVTIDIVDVPWDRALDVVLQQNGLIAKIEGKTIHVTRESE
jgi:beta-lactamase regulating signal transducer with metallopeptidase domain